MLTISDGSSVAKISLLGQYTAGDFALSSDGHGGTFITDPMVSPAPGGISPVAGGISAPSVHAI